jgi:hypothetical protein
MQQFIADLIVAMLTKVFERLFDSLLEKIIKLRK